MWASIVFRVPFKVLSHSDKLPSPKILMSFDLVHWKVSFCDSAVPIKGWFNVLVNKTVLCTNDYEVKQELEVSKWFWVLCECNRVKL